MFLANCDVPHSCRDYKNSTRVGQKATIRIDVDGKGPLEPFPVSCEFLPDGRIVTILRHKSEHSTSVDGFQDPGSYFKEIEYEASPQQIEVLLKRVRKCSQSLSYSCRSARLFNSPCKQLSFYKSLFSNKNFNAADEQTFNPNGWWLSNDNKKMEHWAGAAAGSRKCQCGMEGVCIDPKKWCNCDANRYDWQEDSGVLTDKHFLPVRGLHFGDTGTQDDDKEAKFTLGPLVCEGDVPLESFVEAVSVPAESEDDNLILCKML